MKKQKSILCAAILVIFAILTGCGSSKPSRFYTLTAMSQAEINQNQTTNDSNIAIGFGSTKFADYLERPQIVTYLTPNELALSEYDRWAEPLKENFLRVVAENLSQLIPTDRIYLSPWTPSAENACLIIMEVVQFERQPNNTVRLNVRWSLITEESDKYLLNRKSLYTESPKDKSYQETVAAMSRALSAFCRDLAAEIKGTAGR